jgi:hypothetical protein
MKGKSTIKSASKRHLKTESFQSQPSETSKRQRRRSHGDSFFSTVSDDVERYVLERAREEFDGKMSSAFKDAQNVVKDLEEIRKTQNRASDKKIRFNLKVLSFGSPAAV